MKNSLLHVLKRTQPVPVTSFPANRNLPHQHETVTLPVPVQTEPAPKEKIKRIVVDVPESEHIKIKIFASQYGISIKQLVLIALQDAMQNDEQ